MTMDPESVESIVEVVASVGDEYEHIMVLSTAREHGKGVQRLPDRTDRGRRIAAIQVESDAEAGEVLSRLDRVGRHFHVDVERKRDLHLMSVARRTVTAGRCSVIKPNDGTVDALVAVLQEHRGVDLDGLVVAVYGSGNLGFKFSLRLAEYGCKVVLMGRDPDKVAMLAGALNAVLPRHVPFGVGTDLPAQGIDILVSAVTAEHVISADWVDRLAAGAVCIDVGINNLAPDFIETAQSAGHTCLRLDVRSAGDPLAVDPNPFFTDVAGRVEIDGSSLVAGGHIGRRGELVVDEVRNPTRIIGVANGTGGLLPRDEWTEDISARVATIEQHIARKMRRRDAG